MTRRPLIAGNWKMHKTVREAQELVRELRRLTGPVRDVEIAIAPPYTALWAVAQRLEDSAVRLAAQDIYPKDSGAFTGEVSGPMLEEVGCHYVIVAHSERRQFFGETLETSNERVHAAYRNALVPILCVGEVLEEREAGRTLEVVSEQLEAAIRDVPDEALRRIVVAYEPVWAIGTGKVATPAQAQEVHHMIRERLRHRGADIAEVVRVLYGGSVKPDNAGELLGQPDIDGALVGGASLDAESFTAIIKAAQRS